MNGSQRESVQLGGPRRLALYAVGIGVWMTGGLWLLFHHFLVTQDEFGPRPNPLEPWWLKLHGAFGFAAIWVFGLLWGVHVSRAWPLIRRRWSGSVMTGLVLWLTISGYLLYYVGNEMARAILSILHWVIGLGCPLAFVWHRFSFHWLRARGMDSYPGSIGSARDYDRVEEGSVISHTPKRLPVFEPHGGTEGDA